MFIVAIFQTSCHNPFNGGYSPVPLGYSAAQSVMSRDPALFKRLVQASLTRQVDAINKLAAAGMYFWDYGNAFLLEARRADADVNRPGAEEDGLSFRYPSYVQDIMGDIFSLGFGPFRWVCTSGRPQDLEATDRLAREALQGIMFNIPQDVRQQYQDNIKWIQEAGKHKLVVGSQVGRTLQ